ncbi:winged helix-turn-helix domain-containing protein [Candidatus Nitrosotalea okcheonensis]|uniref:Transcriptional regulator n=1 Tax=Candidatus Nitrosotalea okcheonensis TaxID=1903276 RepID=A0A2H1FCJ9_9ARCH|nr:winged helix-turn-helix domain-containing protein [Candidatus Nitrosotalea okcheonensis]MDE1728333.1 winged helix-turn-helix transcriptional regulator [Nitrososphaerota archaeon]MDE1831052.1 winged helix-turn-helix transcriptional regulator [Nitrososphaerota archaeon]MDE1840915.1 winged helix-turn-helix transcriptional regulator [Nitrososphaerota archaeon]MDE1877274.1 winged helix-turn-helix transcriptional regulator [Nitrososphaerota archaeon]SMH70488.1 Transcriptional regulator [Candidatu
MSDDDDFLVKAQEHIEVISTEDERIKIIGEELANDTGRAIFGKISQGVLSTNDLAKSLNISLPLVNWHITRLLGVGLIKVEKTELSSKNKKMKYYGPVKTAFVIVPPTNPAENNVSRTKKEAIFMQLRHYLASILAFVIVGPLIYLVEQNQSVNQGPVREAAQNSLPHAIESLKNNVSIAPFVASRMSSSPESTIVSADPVMIAIAISGAAAAFFLVFFVIRAFKKLRKIKK